MILIVTNRQDQTADFLIIELNRRGVDYFRFNTEDYPQLISTSWMINQSRSNCYFCTPKRIIDFETIHSVWYRRPVNPVPDINIRNLDNRKYASEESQYALEGIWKTLDSVWVSKPDSIRIAENKMLQLTVAKSIGFTIYPTLVTNIPEDALLFYQQNDMDIICKPIHCGRIYHKEKTHLIFTNPIRNIHLKSFSMIKYSHQIFQKNIHKKLEIRATVIGEQVFAVEIHSQNNKETINDWRKKRSDLLLHKVHMLPSIIAEKCLALVKNLNLNFGALDLILTPENEYVFLEINPNGQWAWIQQICPEIPLRQTLADLLCKYEK